MPFIMRSTRERSLSVSDNFIGGELFNQSLALMREKKFEEAILSYENLFHLWKERSFHFDEVYAKTGPIKEVFLEGDSEVSRRAFFLQISHRIFKKQVHGNHRYFIINKQLLVSPIQAIGFACRVIL